MSRVVLLVEDDAAVRDALAQTLELADISAIPTGSFVAAKDHIRADFEGVVLSDIRMPGRDGFHLLNFALEADRELPVVLLTGEGDIPMAVQAMEKGAFDFLEKPCAPRDLVTVLNRALKKRARTIATRTERARAERGDPASRMVFGVSPQSDLLRAAVRRAAHSGTEVLVCGPPGSGVSKIAEIVHLSGARAHAPFEKRASDGLDRQALFQAIEAAESGTLFLDEISRLAADTQIALVSALEAEPAFSLIAGATADLEDSDLNAELLYRLKVSTVRIPALSERPEDIPVLFQRYVDQAAEQAGLTPPPVSADQLAELMAQDWPGNARSLMSAAMRFVLDLPDQVSERQGLSLAEQMAQVERALLVAALSRQNGRASAAAQALQVPRKTFYDKLARYGIRSEDYRK